MAHVCDFCQQQFLSRNGIFRHLRSSKKCYDLLMSSKKKDTKDRSQKDDKDTIKLKKQKVAIKFGYHVSVLDDMTSREDNVQSELWNNELAAEAVCRALHDSMKDLYPSSPVEFEFEENEGNDEAKLKYSLASGIHLRHPSLMQEASCSAVSDVIGINYRGGPEEIDVKRFVKHMRETLSLNRKPQSSCLTEVQILNMECLPVSTKFHAEKCCSQRCYEYLIPINWLDESMESLEWIRNTNNVEDVQMQPCTTPASLVKLKKVLRLVESRGVASEEKALSSSITSSSGRFGNLGKKEKRPFHNFCDPSLGSGGYASPSNEHVWRSVDKARLSGFVMEQCGNHTFDGFVVVGFRGDGFVSQQIRRMVAAAIAICNDWLPHDYFHIATRLDIHIETPLAPSELLYLSSERFHFVEQARGKPLFSNAIQDDDINDWSTSLQSLLISSWMRESQKQIIWLKNLQHVICPRIRIAMGEKALDDLEKKKLLTQEKENIAGNTASFEDVQLSPVPTHYLRVLHLLKEVCAMEKWPMTSDAFSRVMKSPNVAVDHANSISSRYLGHFVQSGAFTIVNPRRKVGKIPAMNSEFPELVEAIFELEDSISSQTLQTSTGDDDYAILGNASGSTNCIITRNVEFTAHFHSVKGQEGTSSKIVGLGDYVFGEIVVDGKSYNVRYEAFEFDGWKHFYSTNTFHGERFTLLWFTPERRDKETICQGDSCYEDVLANKLLDTHARMLPSFPRLYFRPSSTDALVVNEILNPERCVYEVHPKYWQNLVLEQNESICAQKVERIKSCENGFVLEEKDVVLDIGSHIGVFCRYALGIGCQKIYAYEPELENLKLLQENVPSLHDETRNEKRVEVFQCAVAHGKPRLQNFVHAKSDGTLNTWRHSLEKHSTYVDKKGESSGINRYRVQTIPFFTTRDSEGNIIQGAALRPDITFVKMDCEGAELDILLSPEASKKSNWLDVRKLVFEWSFTKERRVDKFHSAIRNLETAGFTVIYEGKGAWWDTEPNCMWPYHIDLIVFAKM